MRTIYGMIIWACLIVLVAECDNMLAFVLSKIIAGVVIIIVGKLFAKTMSKEELNEEA